jgi:hypothetical protein
MPQVDFNTINESIAKHSREFFVCCESSPKMEELSNLLGAEAEMFSNEEIERLVREVITEG